MMLDKEAPRQAAKISRSAGEVRQKSGIPLAGVLLFAKQLHTLAVCFFRIEHGITISATLTQISDCHHVSS